MEVIPLILVILVVAGAIIWKHKPEWISKVKSWFIE